MDRHLSDDAVERPVVGVDCDMLSASDRPVRTADAGQLHEAVVGDIAHHQPDFVAVAGDGNARRVVPPFRDSDGIAVGVHPRFVGIRLHVVEPATLAGRFESRRSRTR